MEPSDPGSSQSFHSPDLQGVESRRGVKRIAFAACSCSVVDLKINNSIVIIKKVGLPVMGKNLTKPGLLTIKIKMKHKDTKTQRLAASFNNFLGNPLCLCAFVFPFLPI
jgi:hypothetical protein